MQGSAITLDILKGSVSWEKRDWAALTGPWHLEVPEVRAQVTLVYPFSPSLAPVPAIEQMVSKILLNTWMLIIEANYGFVLWKA